MNVAAVSLPACLSVLPVCVSVGLLEAPRSELIFWDDEYDELCWCVRILNVFFVDDGFNRTIILIYPASSIIPDCSCYWAFRSLI
uniref:Putative secreted peptide n=1 Tax=Anopheles braziliensis TaxID=58242 RepID=A0A2M3ZW81_9DIPT